MQTFRRQHVGLDRVVQRPQHHGTRTHLVGQRRGAEIDPFASVAVSLPVQWLMLPVLLEEDRRQKVRAGPAPRHHVERRRRLRDFLTAPAGELLPHRLDHLPPARDRLQRFRHILADLRQPVRSAAGTGRGPRHHHPLARQMLGEGLARRLAPDEPLDLGRFCRRLLGRQPVLGSARLKLVKRKLKLVEKTLLALGPRAVKRPAQLLDHQGQGGDLRLGYCRPRFRRRKCCLEGFNVASGRAGHGAGSESDSPAHGNC